MDTTDDIVAFLADATLDRREVDRFLDPDAAAWARFDSELGYLPNDSDVPDNVDGSISRYRYGSFGERMQINSASEPTRLNTYGNSFTQCHQVSDGETWQEVLAAHFGEPIRNFGVGGFGVYQAAERLRRMEATDAAAPFVVLNIYLDDHYRNIDAYRLLRLGRWWRDYDMSLQTSMFHANPWVHVRIDHATGRIVPRPNLCPTPESLYQLCDTEFLIEHFADDFVVKKLVGDRSGDYGYVRQYEELATTLGIALRPGQDDARLAHALWEESAFSATCQIVQQLREELESAGKRFLVLLTYPGETVAEYLETGTRPDGSVVEFLESSGLPFVDGLRLHANDYEDFSVPPARYVERYYAGHYTPLGNAQYAFMIKDRLIDWLEPAPPAYREAAASFAVQAGRLA